MITRQQYIDNASELHHEYYAQFVTSATIAFVSHYIGARKLLASNDPHLNDVVRWEQGGRTWLWDLSPMDLALAKELGECSSDSTRTCVGKAAARIILAQAKQNKE